MHTLLFILMALTALLGVLIVRAIQASRSTNNPVRRQVVGNYRRKFFRQHVRKVYLAPLLIEKMFGWLPGQRIPRGGIQFANVGEGTHPHGIKSYVPDAATASRYYLYEIGSVADNCRVAAGVNEPLGPSDDLADSAALDIPIAIKLLGAFEGTTRMITDGTVANGARVYASKANPGQVTVPGAGAGTFWLVGKAIIPTDSVPVAGDAIEVVPFQPSQVTF